MRPARTWLKKPIIPVAFLLPERKHTSCHQEYPAKNVIHNNSSYVTNNQAEGISLVLKELQQWKEVPIDCIVLAFINYLQGYYASEIAYGKQKLGNY